MKQEYKPQSPKNGFRVEIISEIIETSLQMHDDDLSIKELWKSDIYF